MSANGTAGLAAVTCIFTNSRQGSITVVKNTGGGDATFPFTFTGTGAQPFSIATSGGAGQRALGSFPVGTYTIAETVPAAWDRSTVVCTGNTSVAGGTATITLGAGDNVTCTYSDIARGTIEISKATVGGDGTFTFSGPESFQITTAGGAGGPSTFPNLVPGTYTVTESVPDGWDLTGIACTDPTSNTTTSGNTATINLGPGEVVACTFTDTQRASITVEKRTTGGDGTFAFTGTQSFSIATTAGNGSNATAFASVAPGVPVSIVESVPA